MELTPDDMIVFTVWGAPVNATIVFTWFVMMILTLMSVLITRNLNPEVPPNRWRTILEAIVLTIQSQINEISARPDRRLLYFAGTLFLFIVVSNLLMIVPGWRSPTSSLSTTAGLTLAVLVAVPLFGIGARGFGGYLRSYIEPNIIMLPFNIIGVFSRGISLAIRLYGNVMSGAVIAAILLGIAPFFFPVVMDLLSLLTGVIQAYIFSILAVVYISSATVPTNPNTAKE